MILARAAAAWLVTGILACLDPALAFEIKGAYGDAEGCKVHRGEQATSDELHLVTATEITTYATSCDIVQLLPTRSGASAVAVGLCGYEGEGYVGVEHFALTFPDKADDADPETLIVYMETGDLWGEVAPCR
ncbi:MAG: hypothetical protein ABTQ31_16285 [Rhizobiaceae bacterium]